MTAFSLANSFVRNALPVEDRGFATLGVVVSCAAILAFVAVRGVGRFGTWRLYGVAFPLELAGLMGLLLASSAGAVAASLFTNAGFALFSLFLDTVLYTISFRYGVNALVLFGWARFAASAGSVAGRIADGAFRMLEGDGRAYAACAVMLLLTLCFVLLTNRGHTEEVAWGVGNQRPAAGPSGTPAQGAPAVRMGLAETVAVISRERGLTRREEQVLELLAQDRTAAEIEAELYVSNATVKTHTRMVYLKLGVHSRRGAADYVKRRAERG